MVAMLDTEGFSQLPIDWNEVQSNRLAGESASACIVSLKLKDFYL